MSPHPIQAQVDSVIPLTDTILQVVLTPERYLNYRAGQYLQIHLDNEAFCFSIANAPLGAHHYELHIRHGRDNLAIQRVLDKMKRRGALSISLPFGECDVSRLIPDRPILFIAAGTGFAPAHAMMEQLLANSSPRRFQCIWGARSTSDLYLDEKMLRWQKQIKHFSYLSHIPESNQKSLSSLVFTEHQHDLLDWQFVINGPFEMVYSLRDQLLEKGVVRSHLFSDAFSFEKGA